jgi:hypothetical protein
MTGTWLVTYTAAHVSLSPEPGKATAVASVVSNYQTKIWSKAPMPAAHTEAQITRIALVIIGSPTSFSSPVEATQAPQPAPICKT